jgi:hypothetical protein
MIDSTHGNVSLLNKSRSKERSPKEHKGTDYAYTLLEQRRPKKKGTVMLPITFQLHECVPTALHTSLHDSALCCATKQGQLLPGRPPNCKTRIRHGATIAAEEEEQGLGCFV